MSTWFVFRSGKKAGPFSIDQLKKFAKQNKLQQSDLIWKEGIKEPINCLLFPEIAVLFDDDKSDFGTNQPASDLKKQSTNVNNSPHEESADIPVLRAKKKSKEKVVGLFNKRYILAAVLSFGVLIIIIIGAFSVFGSKDPYAQSVIAKNEQPSVELSGINNQNKKAVAASVNIEAKIGDPIEIEPGHFVAFTSQGNGSVNTYLENLVGNPLAERIHENTSVVEFMLANRSNNGKIWNWNGFQEIGPITDEFGNELQYLVVPRQVVLSGDKLVYLDNRAVDINPGKNESQIIMFKMVPETSKSFKLKLNYNGKSLILSGLRGETLK